MDVYVEFAADDRTVATPQRLHLGERVIAVVEVLDRWLGADYGYFKIRGDDGRLYIVRLDVPSGRWQLTLYDRRGPERSS
jgi:hypothetical protein